MKATKPSIMHVDCATTYGGSIRSLENFLKARRSSQFRHLVCMYSDINNSEINSGLSDGFFKVPSRYHVIPNQAVFLKALKSLGLSAWFYHILKREKVHLVRTNNGPEAHAPVLTAARIANIPCVVWLRTFPNINFTPQRRWAWLTSKVSRFVANSEAVRVAYINTGIAPHRIITIHNGTPIVPSSKEQDGQFSLNGSFRVGVLGRLVAWKGLINFVRAAAIVLKKHPSVRFEIAGEEDPLEPGFKEKLMVEIDQLHLDYAIRLRGFLDNPLQFLLSLNCLINPSFPAEPFGNSIIEAMALGLPVIATASGGPLEIIEDGYSGILVPPEDPNSLAGAICRLIEDNGLCLRISSAARRRVEEHFEIDCQVGKQEDLFASLISA